MSSETLPALLATLRRQVDASTFARGWRYAQGGAVLQSAWDPGAGRVTGLVQGTSAAPYATSVVVTRSASGQVVAAQGTCSCPVAFNCKHAVALLLVGEAGPAFDAVFPSGSKALKPATAGGASGGNGTAGAPWERALRAVAAAPSPKGAGPLGASEDEGGGPSSALALQFDLVETSGRQAGAGGVRLRVRPAVPGRSGGWVRSGVSWSNVDYLHYRLRAGPGLSEQVALLKELQALGRASSTRSYYSYAEPSLWLETIESPRLWNLLEEAQERGIPLVDSRPKGRPVTLHTVPATASLDLARTAEGLVLRPTVSVQGTLAAFDGCLAVGTSAHGLVWWTRPTGVSLAHATLELGPLAGPVGTGVGQLLAGGRLVVPGHDEERFLRDFYPALGAKLRVVSADGSVDVPAIEPRQLVLTVQFLGGDRCHLAWNWVRRAGEGELTEGLWPLTLRGDERLAEEELLGTVRTALAGHATVGGPTLAGSRLAPSAELSGLGTVTFVAETLPILREIDRVEVRGAEDLPDFRPAETAPVVALGGTGSATEGDWFDLMISVSVDGEEVPFRDLFTALALGETHLILPSGTYFSLDTDELRQLARLISEARRWHEGPSGTIRVSRFQASWWGELRALGVLDEQAAAWETSVRALADAGERVDHPPPAGLAATLRDYQLEGFNWLTFLYENRLGGVLADDMGLGKTVQALALICHVREHAGSGPPFLVVAPTSVVPNWASECRRFAPGLTTVTLTETTARRGVKVAEAVHGADVVVTSYALFRLDFEEYDALEWAGLFLDEAQFVKNHTSQGYRRARLMDVAFKVAMTGTPMENNLLELWALFSITAPGLFGSPEGFTEYFRTPIERRGDAERLGMLRRRIRPLMLRRTKEQVAGELPDKIEQVLEMDLNPRHRKIYQTYLQRERQKVLGLLEDMASHRIEIFRSLTLLRQACLDVGLVDERHAKVPSTKLDALLGMVEEIAADGHRVLVYSQFTRFLTAARRRLEASGIDLCYLDGKTRNRDRVIERFRTGQAPVFLISLKAGGFGLNLTEADYCILLDPWWNPATEAQAVDRAHRIGQSNKVMVYRLVAKGTIEDKVMALKAKKQALFSNVVDSGAFESAALSADDIRGLLA